MPEEAARALIEIGRLREVVDDLRRLLAAAVSAERRAAGQEGAPSPASRGRR